MRDELLSSIEAARRLDVDGLVVYQLIDAGELDWVKNEKGFIRVLGSSVERYREQHPPTSEGDQAESA
jgi:hypothetical protein